MIRSELLLAMAKENPELRADDIEQIADIFFDEIGQRLAESGRVELRGKAESALRDAGAAEVVVS